jgi:subtilase family serine protease
MRSRLVSSLALPAALLAAFATIAQAAVQDRITSAVSSSSRVTLPGTISGHAKRSVDLGSAPGNTQLESLSLRFSMTAAQQADLTQLLAAQVDPTSTSYHQWLTPEQFGSRFGLSSGDLAKVSAWLTSQGFTITSTARSSTFINFSGTVAQAQQAFGTTIHSLSYNGEQHISNITDPTLPSAISGVVTSISGLNDFHMRPRSRASAVSGVTIDPSKPMNTQTINGVVSHFMAPGDFYTIYDLNPLLTGSTPINGAGVTIAVMGQTDLTTGSVLPDANIAAFRSAAGLPAINLKLQLTGTDPGVTQVDIDEAHLDVEWSGAAAPGATILYVYGVDVFNNSLTYAVDNAVAPIITISYGACESEFNIPLQGSTQSPLVADNQMLAMANAEGITVMNSSGDDGATDCDTSGVASEGLNVDFPTSSPFVTSAGGTMFSGDVSNASAYWSSTNGANGGSALGYIPEQPWNETNSSTGLTAGGAGGGGASAFFAKPSWQQGTGAGKTPNDSARDVPDISLNAAANHDGYYVCSQGGFNGEPACTNGFLSSSGQVNVFGGTSIVGPTFSGILALIEQKLGVGTSAATGLGNINPILYGLANGPTYTTIFHDVTTGNNSVSCSQGTPNCPNGGSIGFNATTGYDQASGLGSVDANALANAWKTATPTGTGGSTNGGCSPTKPTPGTSACISATTLTTSSALCAVSASSPAFVLNTAVAGSISGTVPTGTVQFFVDTVSVGSATLANGSATFTLTTSSITSGGHTISAVYSGDSNYAGSKGTLLAADSTLASVDFVSATQKDFSITPCTGTATSVTVQPGATSTGITFTVTPFNGFTGAVTLTAVNNNLGAFTPAFSASPVNITSGAGTTSFTVKAFQTTTTTGRNHPGLAPFHQRPTSRTPWYTAGSGATLACMLLLTFPRRRRWGALLAVLISIAALTAVGCGGNTSNSGGTGGGGGGTTPTTTNAQPGTYTFTITAVSGNLVHSTQVTVNVP